MNFSLFSYFIITKLILYKIGCITNCSILKMKFRYGCKIPKKKGNLNNMVNKVEKYFNIKIVN